MHRLLSTLLAIALLTGCRGGTDEDLVARVAAVEARYHTQARQIDELQAEVAALKAAQPATVIDLVEPPKPQ